MLQRHHITTNHTAHLQIRWSGCRCRRPGSCNWSTRSLWSERDLRDNKNTHHTGGTFYLANRKTKNRLRYQDSSRTPTPMFWSKMTIFVKRNLMALNLHAGKGFLMGSGVVEMSDMEHFFFAVPVQSGTPFSLCTFRPRPMHWPQERVAATGRLLCLLTSAPWVKLPHLNTPQRELETAWRTELSGTESSSSLFVTN